MNVDKRLEQMRERLERSKPVSMTVTFTDGNTTITDYAGAWDIVRDHMLRDGVVSITASRPDYAAMAGVMSVLCHPAPNRRVEDFEQN